MTIIATVIHTAHPGLASSRRPSAAVDPAASMIRATMTGPERALCLARECGRWRFEPTRHLMYIGSSTMKAVSPACISGILMMGLLALCF